MMETPPHRLTPGVSSRRCAPVRSSFVLARVRGRSPPRRAHTQAESARPRGTATSPSARGSSGPVTTRRSQEARPSPVGAAAVASAGTVTAPAQDSFQGGTGWCRPTSRKSSGLPTPLGETSSKHLCPTAPLRMCRRVCGELFRVRRAADLCPHPARVGHPHRQPRQQPRGRLRRRGASVDSRGAARRACRVGREARGDRGAAHPRHTGRLPRVCAVQVGRAARRHPGRGEAGEARGRRGRRGRGGDPRRGRRRDRRPRPARNRVLPRREPREQPCVRARGDQRGRRSRRRLRSAT